MNKLPQKNNSNKSICIASTYVLTIFIIDSTTEAAVEPEIFTLEVPVYVSTKKNWIFYGPKNKCSSSQ
jgi:hypothetical protein